MKGYFMKGNKDIEIAPGIVTDKTTDCIWNNVVLTDENNKYNVEDLFICRLYTSNLIGIFWYVDPIFIVAMFTYPVDPAVPVALYTIIPFCVLRSPVRVPPLNGK